MITIPKHIFESACKQRGYDINIAKECIISEKNNILTIDETHPNYPKQKPKNNINIQSINTQNNSGPGTELKKLLKKIGIVASDNCACNQRAKIMDQWGPDICEQRIDEIVGWLREEANKRGLPFIDYAGRILVKKAISNARKKIV